MKSKRILITDTDFRQLQRLIEASRGFRHRDAQHLNDLEEELERAMVVKSGKVPRDVVTMNSRVRVKDLANGREATFEIVFPSDADIAKNRISVLAPIGTNLLGYHTGATIECPVPSGMRRFRILEVEYQPEAARAAA